MSVAWFCAATLAGVRRRGTLEKGGWVYRPFLVETSNHIRPLRLSRDLSELADLLEQAFGPELALGGAQMLRELRFLGRLGPLSLLLLDVSSPVDGLSNGFVYEHEGRVVGNVTLSRPTRHAHRWQKSPTRHRRWFRNPGRRQTRRKEMPGDAQGRC